MKNLLFILLVKIVFSIAYRKVVHNYNPQAKCLDGSPGLLYVHEGYDKQNILIYFFGGGLCGDVTVASTLQNCYQRSKTFLGSSKLWPEQFPQQISQGYLSLNQTVSPFHNWTKFLIGYCDGSLHQGYNQNPIKYKDAELYFRGGAITRSHFDWINQKYGLKKAKKIVLTGGSAGGLATNLWNNFLKSYVENPDKVYSIGDSGIFMNQKTIHGMKKIQTMVTNIYKVANTKQSTPFNECNTFYKGEQWRCLFFEYGYAAIKGKYLVINSQYDSWAIYNILQVKCLKDAKIGGSTLANCSVKQKNEIEEYRSKYMQVLSKFITLPQKSIWTIGCSNHVYSSLNLFYDSMLQVAPRISHNTVKQAIKRFVFNNQKIFDADVQKWPANSACAY